MEYTAGISITENCNLCCKHCYIGRKNMWRENHYVAKSLSLEQFELLLPKLREANVTRVNFGGGESTLHKDFITIVKRLHENNIKCSLVTNGLDFSMKIIRPYLHLFNDIGISIDFPDDRHSNNRGMSNVFATAVKNLKELASSGLVKTEIVTCIMNTNYKDLPALYSLAKECGVDMWRLNRFHATKNDAKRFASGVTDAMDISYLACSHSQMKEALLFLASVSPKVQNYCTPDPVFRTLIGGKAIVSGVPYGKVSFRIKSDGGVVPNLFVDEPVGNINDLSLKDILRGSGYINHTLPLAGKCLDCVNRIHCRGGDSTDRLLSNSLEDPYCFLDTKKVSSVSFMSLDDTNFVHESYLGTIYIPINWRLKNG